MPFKPYAPGTQPGNDTPAYRSTGLRHPTQSLLRIPQSVTELSGPQFSPAQYPPTANIAVNDGVEAMGERIIVQGRVLDEDGRPVAGSMVEIWQANAAGRYNLPRDAHDAPLDPGFKGIGRVFTDAQGGYRFITIKPGAYPWGNHENAWRPNHIHFSLFGPGYATRLITQMYFPGDPLLALDPIFLATPDAAARARLVASFDLAVTQPNWALGYRFDIVLRGRNATPMEDGDDHH
ncbi:MAG: protocatechuate 3,4-dioxygenase subunit beta [Acidocella sp.]|nr:protocatechuate 3,4-dioxygenase subunit beta [Acidocella sp.]